MKKTLIAMGVLGAFSSLAFAASNVTLYGIIEEGVIVQKATVYMKRLRRSEERRVGKEC